MKWNSLSRFISGRFSVLFSVLCERMAIASPAFDLNEFLLVLLQCRCSWRTTRFQSRAIETRTFFIFHFFCSPNAFHVVVIADVLCCVRHTNTRTTRIRKYSTVQSGTYLEIDEKEGKKRDKLDLVSLEMSITKFTNAEENISIVTIAFFST